MHYKYNGLNKVKDVSMINIGNSNQKGIKTWYSEICKILYSSFKHIIICVVIFKTITKRRILFLFLIICFKLSFLQWIMILKSPSINRITSYTHTGRKIRNQFHWIRPSSCRHNKMKNKSNINHVNSALCITILLNAVTLAFVYLNTKSVSSILKWKLA